MAQYFGVEVEELGELHQIAKGNRVQINSTCSVFALSEVVSYLVENIPKEDVIAGIHYAFAKRMSFMIPKETGSEKSSRLNWPTIHFPESNSVPV